MTLGEIEQRIYALAGGRVPGSLVTDVDLIMDDIKAMITKAESRAHREGYDDGYADADNGY